MCVYVCVWVGVWWCVNECAHEREREGEKERERERKIHVLCDHVCVSMRPCLFVKVISVSDFNGDYVIGLEAGMSAR